MIEAFSIPVLIKAVDFLFEEATKILQERRDRRKGQQEVEKAEIATQRSVDEPQAIVAIQSKDVALSQMIDKALWADKEAEVTHLLCLLEVHTRNYYITREQYAKWGSALVPPVIVHNLNEAEDEVAHTTRKLQDVLSSVYGKKVVIPEMEQA